jgi:solute carrier family 25 (mitochondrial aspartate/glutamate transporter), member 12/13
MAGDLDSKSEKRSLIGSAVSGVRRSVAAPESEQKRWRKTFDAYAITVEGEKWTTLGLIDTFECWTDVYDRYLNRDSFIRAIAPKGDLSKIERNQYGALFRVADLSKRGLISWVDFNVFETLLKRPDADYWIAFQYFDR